MPKRRKPPRGCSIAFFLFLLFIILLYVFVYSDIRTMPDDSDLRLVYEDIPDEENAFARLMKAAAAIDLTPEEESCLDTADRDGFWDAELAEAIVAKNEKAIAEYEAALACARSQAPPVQALDAGPVPESEGLGRLGDLLEQHARFLRESGDDKAAFRAAFDIVRCGDILKRSNAAMLIFVHGLSLQETGLRLARDFAANSAAAPEELEAYIPLLEPYIDDAEAWADMYRGEFMSSELTLRDLVGDQTRKLVPGGSDGGPAPTGAQRRAWPLPFVYQPQKTVRMLADFFHIMMATTELTYDKIDGTIPQEETDAGTLRLMLTGNVLGRITYDILTFGMHKMPQGMCITRTRISATQVLIALKCHEMKTGALPESLDELVPEYFESVPLDYFDGEPMKYAPETRLVYCVGPDLEDTGGTAGDGNWAEMPDPSWEIP